MAFSMISAAVRLRTLAHAAAIIACTVSVAKVASFPVLAKAAKTSRSLTMEASKYGNAFRSTLTSGK